jgi:hypothetical protein
MRLAGGTPAGARDPPKAAWCYGWGILYRIPLACSNAGGQLQAPPQQIRRSAGLPFRNVVPLAGFELATFALRMRCSTN